MAFTDAQAKKALNARREELISAQTETEDDRKPVELDQASVGRLSRMDAMQMQAMAQERERRRDLELRKIDAALRRLEAGSYGDCQKCGDEIAAKRLALDPAAAYCIACASGVS